MKLEKEIFLKKRRGHTALFLLCYIFLAEFSFCGTSPLPLMTGYIDYIKFDPAQNSAYVSNEKYIFSQETSGCVRCKFQSTAGAIVQIIDSKTNLPIYSAEIGMKNNTVSRVFTADAKGVLKETATNGNKDALLQTTTAFVEYWFCITKEGKFSFGLGSVVNSRTILDALSQFPIKNPLRIAFGGEKSIEFRDIFFETMIDSSSSSASYIFLPGSPTSKKSQQDWTFVQKNKAQIYFKARGFREFFIALMTESADTFYGITIGAENNTSTVIGVSEKGKYTVLATQPFNTPITGGLPALGNAFDNYWIKFDNTQISVGKGQQLDQNVLAQTPLQNPLQNVQKVVFGGNNCRVEYTSIMVGGLLPAPASDVRQFKPGPTAFSVPDNVWLTNMAFAEAGKGVVTFDARGFRDMIVLLAEPGNEGNMYALTIGAGSATQRNSYVRLDKILQNQKQLLVERLVENALTGGFPAQDPTFDSYWIRLETGTLSAGKGTGVGEKTLIAYKDATPLTKVQVVGLAGWRDPVEYKNIKILALTGTKAPTSQDLALASKAQGQQGRRISGLKKTKEISTARRPRRGGIVDDPDSLPKSYFNKGKFSRRRGIPAPQQSSTQQDSPQVPAQSSTLTTTQTPVAG